MYVPEVDDLGTCNKNDSPKCRQQKAQGLTVDIQQPEFIMDLSLEFACLEDFRGRPGIKKSAILA